MLFTTEIQKSLKSFLQEIRLLDRNYQAGKDKNAKINQILAFLEIINTQIGRYSRKRDLVFIDGGAGNCYLSFLVYFYYTIIDGRHVQIHCLENNGRLMEKNRRLAEELGFDKMCFHTCDIAEYVHSGQPDVVYSLHACDTATDKTLFLGLETGARNILSVSCCQHTIKKQMRSQLCTGLTRNRVFKEKLSFMIGDSARALLVEMQNYKVDIIDFVSSRATDKNSMLRAQKGQQANYGKLIDEYLQLQNAFHVSPVLEEYLANSKSLRCIPKPEFTCTG